MAHNGSILVCSHQIKEKKLDELPSNLIVFATTSQLVDSISEALKIIKERYQKNIPNNITTLKHFQQTPENKDDFLSYGSASKNVYLLLLEDFWVDERNFKTLHNRGNLRSTSVGRSIFEFGRLRLSFYGLRTWMSVWVQANCKAKGVLQALACLDK